ncbi:MAG: hypothetical protein HY897_08450 [Deltaproteobacteria bacterium]|nr:hypothetical protein [Deltaproteobacteria bacterium]
MKKPFLSVVFVIAALLPAGAFAQVELNPTGFSGTYPRVQAAPDGSFHMIYFSDSGGDIRHARFAGGAWGSETAVPQSGNASTVKYNLASFAVDPGSKPHVVWGPGANWQDISNHTRGVGYWNGATGAQREIFDDYTEYVALGINTAGRKLFASAVILLPGDSAPSGIAWAEMSGDSLGGFTRFDGADHEGKYVSFCVGSDGTLHLVWRWRYVRYAKFDGNAWNAVERLATSDGSAEYPSCSVDASGNPHVGWLMWQDTGGGTWKPTEIRYAVHKNGSWRPSTDGYLLQSLSAGGTSPTAASDALGNVAAVWSEGSRLMLAVSTDGGDSFGSPSAVRTDLKPGYDTQFSQPSVPVFVYDGKFQAIYTRSDGELVRAVFTDIVVVEKDAGTDDTGIGDAGVSDSGAAEDGSNPDATAGDTGELPDSALPDSGEPDATQADAAAAKDTGTKPGAPDGGTLSKDTGTRTDSGDFEYGLGCGCATVGL